MSLDAFYAVTTLGGRRVGSWQKVSCLCRSKWLLDLVKMERSTGRNHLSTGKRPLELSTSVNEGKRSMEENENTSTFVNHGARAWHESRKKWLGSQSQLRRIVKDPTISWLTTYEELLSTNEPFSEPIPLPEMVEFLVDIWYDEGLYD